MKITNLKKNNCVLEFLKWIFVIFLLILMFIGNFSLYKENLVIQICITAIILFLVGLVVATTEKGKFIIFSILESYHEMKKVIWPTHQEVLHNTIIIIMVTIVTSMAIWGLDNLLIQIISFSTSIRLF